MSNISAIEEVAHKVASNINAKNKTFSIDPFTIITIINCIIGIIRLIYQCRKNRTSVKRVMHRPGIMSRFLMKRVVKQHFPEDMVNDAYKSMLTVSREMSETELEEVLNEFEERNN